MGDAGRDLPVPASGRSGPQAQPVKAHAADNVANKSFVFMVTLPSRPIAGATDRVDSAECPDWERA
uniref:Uncharacterized protein n=1 Tax=Ralstonia solanacearum CFBP2957 TaxID=859656 RepID=D8P506_RALSL|nr:protein of unknown function [Ralstonia solanacearum CFBP2957]